MDHNQNDNRIQKFKTVINERIRVGFIGAGNIANAICGGLLNSGLLYINIYMLFG